MTIYKTILVFSGSSICKKDLIVTEIRVSHGVILRNRVQKRQLDECGDIF